MFFTFDWQADEEAAARAFLFIVPFTDCPNAAAMCADDPTGNGKPKPWPTAFEAGLSRRMQGNAAQAVKLLKNFFEL